MTPSAVDRHALPGRPALGGAVVLGLLLVAAVWLPAPGRAHMRGMFATKAEAEKRAAELKCKGVFAMGSLWMPCANERALHDALQKAQR
jgi:hypothetical protein